MRRISILLAIAAILISAGVGYTYKLRLEKARKAKVLPAPPIPVGIDARSLQGWRYQKSDPDTGKPIVKVEAKSFEATHDPSTFDLHDVALRIYDKNGGSYTY